MVAEAAALQETAWAKINLTLHVTNRRADGFHLLDSLVVFADFGDVVSLRGSGGLNVSGPFAAGISNGTDNLVLQAAKLIGWSGGLHLEKNLPVAAGLGGGSADAAATLRLLARVLGQPVPLERAVELGADVPVCLTPSAQRMGGIGEVLTPLIVPEFWLVLANPGVAVKTARIFATLKARDNPAMDWHGWSGVADFVKFLRAQRNDLQETAIGIVPVIGEVLAVLAGQKGCALARMSGSGATCFGVFERQEEAEAATLAILRDNPTWWVKAVRRV